ncbi:MAG: hypothetical protein J6I45_01570 [Clostridia bacterium]|nr:hypothetical protein [Clostridia bacterium]
MMTTRRTAAPMRMIACLLALLMLASCGNADAPEETKAAVTTAAPVETEAPKPADGLENVDMDGFEMNILASLTRWTKAQYLTEENGEPVNDALYKRNRYLEERFKAKFNIHQDESQSHGDVALMVANQINSDDHKFEVVSIYDIYIKNFMPCVSDWNNIPHLRLNEVWWNPDATEVFNWGGKQIALNGYTSISAASCTNGVVFNKDMLKALNFDQNELYSSAREGSWTLDKMYEYGKAAVQDLNGDSIYDDQDQWGFHDAASTKAFVNAAVASSGVRYIDYDEDHYPVFAFDNERSISVLQTFIDKTFTSGAYWTNVKNPDNGTEPLFFELNRSLFAQANLMGMENLRNVEGFEIGILPFPKFDESVENYRSLSVGSSALFLLRTTTPDKYENLGILLEAMAYYTYHEVLPIYKEVALKTKAARDDESADMLDIIFSTISFDLGHSLESLVTKPIINDTFIIQDSGRVASAIEKNKKRIQTQVDDLIEASELVG